MVAAMKIEPEKFRPQHKVHKIFRVGGIKTRVGRVSGNDKIFFRPNVIEVAEKFSYNGHLSLVYMCVN